MSFAASKLLLHTSQPSTISIWQAILTQPVQPILSDTSLERLTLDKSDREQTDTEVKILKAVDEQSHMYLTDLDIQVQFPCPCVTKAADSSLRASSYGVFQQVCFKCGFVASTTL